MPSTFTTDPVGPRSVDEMLDVVYDRAAVLQRRRTVQRMGGLVAAMVLAVFGALTLQGSDEGAQVRLVGQPSEEEAERGPAPGPGNEQGAAGPAPAGDDNAAGPTTTTAVRTAPAVTTPTTSTPPVTHNDPAPVTLKAISDGTGDANPDRWYYDITRAEMVYDQMASNVRFSTQYRTASGSGPRDERVLETVFSYDGYTYAVTVRETGNQLGAVHIDDSPTACTACSASFDVGSARLVVNVPVTVVNDAVARKSDSPAFGAGVRIDGLLATSSTVAAGERAVDADTAGSVPA